MATDILQKIQAAAIEHRSLFPGAALPQALSLAVEAAVELKNLRESFEASGEIQDAEILTDEEAEAFEARMGQVHRRPVPTSMPFPSSSPAYSSAPRSTAASFDRDSVAVQMAQRASFLFSA